MISTGLTITFLQQFLFGIELTSPLLLTLLVLIIVLGQFAGSKEGWSRLDSLYFAFVTATTLGYGDLMPTQRRSRILAIVIAVLGLILSGIIIAVAVESTMQALHTIGRWSSPIR